MQLADEATYLDRVRQCVLDWPATLISTMRTELVTAQLAELEQARDRLADQRLALLADLRRAYVAPDVARFSAFPWPDGEREQVREAARRVRHSIARLSGAIRASNRTLAAWSEAVTALLAGLMGHDPRATRYTAQGRRAV